MIAPILAYGQLVLGLPIVVAYLVLLAPNYFIEKIGESREISVCYYMAKNVLEGIIAILFASSVYYYLQVEDTLWIPIVLLAETSIWKTAQNEGFMIWFIHTGIVAGYLLFPFMLAAIPQW